jgi:hypothetical protein
MQSNIAFAVLDLERSDAVGELETVAAAEGRSKKLSQV